jgi:hypothetical protein
MLQAKASPTILGASSKSQIEAFSFNKGFFFFFFGRMIPTAQNAHTNAQQWLLKKKKKKRVRALR